MRSGEAAQPKPTERLVRTVWRHALAMPLLQGRFARFVLAVQPCRAVRICADGLAAVKAYKRTVDHAVIQIAELACAERCLRRFRIVGLAAPVVIEGVRNALIHLTQQALPAPGLLLVSLRVGPARGRKLVLS
jgi:hypothetical protein